MNHLFAVTACFIAAFATRAALAAESVIIDSMDAASFVAPAEKARVELVEGHDGKAQNFSFDADAKGAFIRGRVRGNADWDKAAGFSFWVKGDGSNHLGGIEVIWNEDYAARYAYAFPINGTEWQKVVVSWRDLIPEMGKTTKLIDAQNGNAPSKLGPISFGKWWYWKDYAAHSYIIDDIRLETAIATPPVQNPTGAPLQKLMAKLKAGQPITIVTMGDSLTDTDHWANKETNWPSLLKAQIKEKYGSEVTIINPAIGGTELRQNLILMPRWTQQNPQPDLVTVFFGFNDWAAGMRGEGFLDAQKAAVDRIRRATNGQANVLLLSTCPPLEMPTDFGHLAEAVRTAAQEGNAGLADIDRAFGAVAPADRAALYVHDKVHLSPIGHALVAKTIMESFENTQP